MLTHRFLLTIARQYSTFLVMFICAAVKTSSFGRTFFGAHIAIMMMHMLKGRG